MSYFSFFSPYVPATPQQSWSMSIAVEARHEREQIEGRQADPVAAELARRMVRQRLVETAEARVEPALLVEVEQELADVPGRTGHGAGVVVVDVEHLAVLGLERVGARRRGADDPVAASGVVGEDGEVASAPGRGRSRRGRC